MANNWTIIVQSITSPLEICRVHYGIPQIESSKKELAHEHQNIQILMILMSDNKMKTEEQNLNWEQNLGITNEKNAVK